MLNVQFAQNATTLVLFPGATSLYLSQLSALLQPEIKFASDSQNNTFEVEEAI
ncbi:MAG: hypothetical protein LBC61_00920 [Candidatus Peribacteria bacterium]|nr:hypothetical protein [Candidatus Peribacteria bacterium]